MASHGKTSALAFFLVLNLVLFTFASACGSNCPTPKPKPKPKPTPKPCPPPKPTPSPSTPSPGGGKATCPKDALKLGVCADLLGGLIGITIGTPSKSSCCSLIQGLADLDAAVCLCTAIKANVLGINLNVPLSLSLLLNACDKKAPEGFKCS